MPRTYKLLTALSALAGNLALVITGELNPLFVISGSAIFIGYYRAIRGYPQAPRLLVGGLSTLVVFIFVMDAFLITGDMITAVAHLTLLFHAIKSFDMKEHWDSLQVFFMSLIQLLLASELTFSIVFGVLFVIFMIIMVVSISYSHLIKEGKPRMRPFVRPVTVTALLVLLMTVLLFIALPRVKGRLWGKGIGRGIRTGFSETLQLGSFGEVKRDPTVVMRVKLEPRLTHSPYLRGMTFEIYRDDTWLDIKDERWRYVSHDGRFSIEDSSGTGLIRQEVLLEPLDTDLIFTLRGTTEVVAESRFLLRDLSGSLYIPQKRSKRTGYTAFSTDEALPVSEPLPLYLQLPEGSERIKRLAEDVAREGGSDLERAGLIQRYLKENYTYSLKVDPPAEGMDPVEDFLFRTRKGYCEHYATSMVLMLRSIGIPARVVSGFLGGEYNRYGGYLIVRQSDAHTWVEAAIDGHWVRFDPTPGGVSGPKPETVLLYLDLLKLHWERYVVGYSRFDQMRLFSSLSASLRPPRVFRDGGWRAPAPTLLLIGVVPVVLLLIVRLYRRPKRYSQASRYYLDIRRRLGRTTRVKDSHTGGEILAGLEGLDSEKALLIKEFFDLYGRIRFGGHKAEGLMVEYKAAYRRVKRLKIDVQQDRGLDSR